MSVPVPGQVLKDPASVRRVCHSCSTQILLSDATVQMREENEKFSNFLHYFELSNLQLSLVNFCEYIRVVLNSLKPHP